MRKYFIIFLSFFTVCILYPKDGIAEYSRMQLSAINDLTAEFEKSGKDFAKPTAEIIRRRFNTDTDKDFNSYSDILFKGAGSFDRNGKNAAREQKTSENAAWDKAVSTSKQATNNTLTPNYEGDTQKGCKKYGIAGACNKAGETR